MMNQLLEMDRQQKRVLKTAHSLIFAVVSLALIVFRGMAGAQTILPGAQWYDTSGNQIQAHGAGIIEVDSTYYLIGEQIDNNGGFLGINCYSSNDLVRWTFIADVLPPQSSGDLGPSGGAGRPKVFYNASTQKYVMWLGVNSPTNGHAVGYATSPTVCGTYTYQGSSLPMGNTSFDIGGFQDTDGNAYLLSAHYYHGLNIYKMAPDYLSAVSTVAGDSTFGDGEAPAMFKANGYYFFIYSHQTGYTANNDQYTYATSINGPWSSSSDIAPAGMNTWTSQSSLVATVAGSSATTYIFGGDRWLRGGDLIDSTYLWLPMTLSGHTLSLPWVNSWTPNIATGTWTNNAFPYLYKGSFHHLVNLNSGLCLDQVSTSQGTQAQGVRCDTANLQEWNITSSNGIYSIAAQSNGFLLEDYNNSTAASSPIDTWPNDGGSNQQWTFTNVGSNNYTIKNNYSGLCLSVTGASLVTGAGIDEGTCDGGTNQQWYQR